MKKSTDVIALIDKALRLAERVHATQKRPQSGEDYINHPRRVAESLTDPLAKIVGWLHDTVEDSEEPDKIRQEITDLFPPEVLEAVECLTKREKPAAEPYPDYIDRVASSPLAVTVKLADLRDNLCNQGDAKKREKYEWALGRLTEIQHSAGRTSAPPSDRHRGALLGLAAGDALGTTLEFKPPGTFKPMTDIVGGGPFRLKPGQWTDDTSMALCLAESLVECQGFDPVDQLGRYVRWWRDGHLSSTSECFDIGNTTSAALSRFERTGEPWCGATDPNMAGNGSIMRLAPVPLFFAADPQQAIERAADSSRTTHRAPTCVDACRYLAGLIVGAVRGVAKPDLLADHYSPVDKYWESQPLCPEVDEIAGGSFRHLEPPAIKGSGYVVKSLEAALWAFHKTDNFRDGALLAVNLGDDADTTGAVYGQLAGAYYGEAGMPNEWLRKLAMRDVIGGLADRLHTFQHPSGNTARPTRKEKC